MRSCIKDRSRRPEHSDFYRLEVGYMRCEALGCNKEAEKKIEYDLGRENIQELHVCSEHQDINENVMLEANYEIV